MTNVPEGMRLWTFEVKIISSSGKNPLHLNSHFVLGIDEEDAKKQAEAVIQDELNRLNDHPDNIEDGERLNFTEASRGTLKVKPFEPEVIVINPSSGYAKTWKVENKITISPV